jgi:hypothetical protein
VYAVLCDPSRALSHVLFALKEAVFLPIVSTNCVHAAARPHPPGLIIILGNRTRVRKQEAHFPVTRRW